MDNLLNEFEQYLINIKHASLLTIEAYHKDLTKMFRFLSKYYISAPDQITETILTSYVLAMEKEGLSASTINRSLSSQRTFFLFCIKKGIMNFDPSDRIKLLKYEKKPARAVGTDEINRLLEMPDLSTKKGVRDKAMLELLYATGIRVSELLELTTENLSMKLRFISVKSASNERVLPFGAEAERALICYLSEYSEQLTKQNILFCTNAGLPMSRQGFWKLIKQYGKKAGISTLINPQIFRNSFAMHMLENGADSYSIKELLGYRDIAAVQKFWEAETGKTREIYQKTHPRA